VTGRLKDTAIARTTMLGAAAFGAIVAALAAAGCSPAPPPLDARVAAFAQLPDWSGIWEPTIFVGEGIGQALSPEGLKSGEPILTAKMPLNA